MRATASVPSASTMDCVVSIWTSKRNVRSGRSYADSRRASTSAATETWSTAVTFGSVTTNPDGSGPCSSRLPRNRSRVRIPRWRVKASKLLKRMPTNGVPPVVARVCPAARAAASSTSSGTRPKPSSKSIRRSSIGSVSSLARTRS